MHEIGQKNLLQVRLQIHTYHSARSWKYVFQLYQIPLQLCCTFLVFRTSIYNIVIVITIQIQIQHKICRAKAIHSTHLGFSSHSFTSLHFTLFSQNSSCWRNIGQGQLRATKTILLRLHFDCSSFF